MGTITTYQTLNPDGSLKERMYKNSQSSSRVNGKLVLQANPFSYVKSTCTQYCTRPRGFAPPNAGAYPAYEFTSANYNEVYSKFVGKLHRGDASLGVTMASWGQSSRMITGRLGQISNIFTDVGRRVQNQRSRGRRYGARPLANDFLEGEFGWIPLLNDIRAVISTVFGNDAIPPQWCRASSTYPANKSEETLGFPNNYYTFSGSGRLTISAKVEIANPNIWVLNRLGLINPLTVAWDLVPWSFVVNMFANVNQIIGGLSDTVGLTISDASVTYSSRVLMETTVQTKWSPTDIVTTNSSVNCRTKSRLPVGSIPRPSLQFKLPNVNLELAAIAAALLAQKVGRI